jgi:hypothetical protein
MSELLQNLKATVIVKSNQYFPLCAVHKEKLFLLFNYLMTLGTSIFQKYELEIKPKKVFSFFNLLEQTPWPSQAQIYICQPNVFRRLCIAKSPIVTSILKEKLE